LTGRPARRACGPARTLPALLAWNRDSLLGVLIPESDGTTIAALWLILAPAVCDPAGIASPSRGAA